MSKIKESSRTYISDELFHFVGWRHPTLLEQNFNILKEILRGQRISHDPHNEDAGEIRINLNWEADIYKGELVSPTVTCYADIPQDCLLIHTKKYGEFGLSFSRLTLAARGARPVKYMPFWPGENTKLTIDRGAIIERLFNAAKAFNELRNELTQNTYKRAKKDPAPPTEQVIDELHTVLIKDILPFVKPFSLAAKDDDPDNYYMEREWRKYGNLEFSPSWVNKIVVASGYASQIHAEFPQYEGKIYECKNGILTKAK